MLTLMPGGKLGLILVSSSRSAFDKSSGFATACLISPILIDGWPL